MKSSLKILLFIILLIPAFWWLLGSGYFNMHDDLQVMRLFEMDKCLFDGQIPCRWSPDMVWGYGQPMFNYYSAFPYYLGAILRIIFPLTYLGTVKMLFLLSFVIAGVGMYKLAREFWGTLGGIFSAVLYTYAPYHALDIYVRGALSETFALSLLPWMFYFSYKLIKKYSLLNFVGVALSIAFVLMTHNISTMIYAPITVLWCAFWLIVEKKLKSIPRLIFAGMLGVGLASFFIIPAVFEQNIIQTQFLTSNYSDYRGHFVTLRQLFVNRNWGDGPSIYGDNEDISFQIGWPHWWLGIIAGLSACYLVYKKKIELKIFFLIAGLSFGTLFFAFMTHHRSFFLWEIIPKVDFVQFPWRFLGLVMFFLAFLGGSISLSKNILSKLFIPLLIILTIVLNFSYFIPVHYSRKVTDQGKLTGLAFELQQRAAIIDYLPKTAKSAPESKAFERPKSIEGDLTVGQFSKTSDSFSFDVDVYTPSSVEVPLMYFPGWTVYVDGKIVDPQTHGNNGLIKVTFDPGQHQVYGKFANTPIRKAANLISLLSIGMLLVVIAFGGKYEKDGSKSV